MSTALASSLNEQTPSPAPYVAGQVAQEFVGELPVLSPGLSDEERERHIESCTFLLEQAYDRYCETNCLGDRGEADRWRLMRDEAIKGRSPEQIARMERKCGLA